MTDRNTDQALGIISQVDNPTEERGSGRLTQAPDAYQARLAAYLIANSLQAPSKGTQPHITVNISHSFNTSHQANQLRYQQAQLPHQPEKFSRVVPGLFIGFWLISIMCLLVSGVSNND